MCFPLLPFVIAAADLLEKLSFTGAIASCPAGDACVRTAVPAGSSHGPLTVVLP